MPSLVAIETISAHEITFGQSFSSSSLMESILSKPLKVWLGMTYLSMEVFITISVNQEDWSITTLIKKIPHNIKTNK